MKLNGGNIENFLLYVEKNAPNIDFFKLIKETITSEYFIQILELFIKSGGQINVVDKNGRTPIFELSSFDVTSVIANPIDLLNSETKMKTLQTLVTANICQGIEIMVKNGVNIHHVANDGSNAAHYLYFYLRDPVVRMFVKYNVDLTKKDIRNEMPIELILSHADYATIINIIEYSVKQSIAPPYLQFIKGANAFITLMASKDIEGVHKLLKCDDQRMQRIYKTLHKRFGMSVFDLYH